LLSAPLLPGTEPEKKEQAAVAPEAVVFCAYNLKNWLTMDRFDGTKTVLQSPKPEAEKEAVLAIISAIHPDILGVCEVGTEDDVHDLQKRLRSRGLDYPHVERAQGGDQTRSLALLSRFPIIARNSQTNLTYRIKDTAFPVQRGFLDATVKIADGFEMRCIGAHLKSKREIEEADQALMRRSEAHLLRKHLDSIIATDKDSKILLYGDFNEHRNEPAISTLIGSRASDSYMGEVKIWDVDGEVWTHFWDAADVYSRFDYFFASKALRPHIFYKKSFIYSKREFDQASDHRPIITTIRLKPPE
jgi:endonuclease/exonuclease/phosphatase family metal-dependent hydrolase